MPTLALSGGAVLGDYPRTLDNHRDAVLIASGRYIERLAIASD
jgi:hypothetical protein